MTEAEWLASDDPQPMLEWVSSQPADRVVRSNVPVHYVISDRKLRLFACACCRQVWHLLTDERSRRAVEVAERDADGEVSPEQYHQAWSEAWSAGHTLPLGPLEAWVVFWLFGRHDDLGGIAGEVSRQLRNSVPPATQAVLLRDIVGNPFRSVSLPWRCRECGIPCGPPAAGYYCVKCGSDEARCCCPWLTPTVMSIARTAYDDRRFDLLPILADALEEAGCDNTDILQHCRGSGPHARGCFVLDLILGKE
jgi:hypothetical protein